MTARTQPRPGWVTVAAAAAALTDAGDKIDASNVSRYLARFPEIPQEKAGKFRWVELKALVAHRSGNVLVVEKREARELPEPVAAAPQGSAALADVGDDEDDAPPARGGSAISDANLELKQLKIHEARLDLAEREGRLVKADEVLAVLTAYGDALVGELERQEALLATTFGREVAAEIRKARKAAQVAASRRLLELARKHLPGHVAAEVTQTPASESAAAA